VLVKRGYDIPDPKEPVKEEQSRIVTVATGEVL
jgi:hypothetical protein